MTNSAPDSIVEAVRAGRKEEALRLIAIEGVWMPFRDPGYFDTETCFPIFSSPDLIPPFLESIGFTEQCVKAQQVGPDFFSFAAHLESTLTLNPRTDSEWKFGDAEFSTIAAYAKRG